MTADELKGFLNYDPDTGIFRWLVAGGQKRVGDIAGRISNQGYRQIQIRRKLYLAGRLAWLYSYGVWPRLQIDHINRIRSDDRLCNLRDVSGSINCHNRKPTLGITKHGCGRWQAQVSYMGRKIYLGLFDTELEASAVYRNAVNKARAGIEP